MKKPYQVNKEWQQLIDKDTVNSNLWHQVQEEQVFSRKEFLDQVTYGTYLI